MKKMIALVLAALMALSLCACGGSSNESKAYEKALKAVQAPAKADKVLTVATSPDFAPMEFYDAAKKGDAAIVGFDILLANFIAKELGMSLKLTPMSFDACQAAVQSGKADIAISGFSWMPERAENYELTDWYPSGNETNQTLVVAKDKAGTYTKPEDFKGMKIGYQGASLQEYLVQSIFADVEGCDITNVYADLGTAAEALKAGKIDALCCAEGNGDAIASASNGAIVATKYFLEIDDIFRNNLCLIQKGNTELLEKVNKAIAKVKEQKLPESWIEVSKIYAGVSTLDELGYDDEGNKITK